MKLFSAIMAIYVFGLVFVPCADVHAENDHGKNFIGTLSTHDHQQEHLIDTCSPFCFCACCQTISPQAIYYSFAFEPVLIGSFDTYIKESEYFIAASPWRPPKI